MYIPKIHQCPYIGVDSKLRHVVPSALLHCYPETSQLCRYEVMYGVAFSNMAPTATGYCWKTMYIRRELYGIYLGCLCVPGYEI